MTNTCDIQIQRLLNLTPEQYAEAIWNGAERYCRWYGFGKEPIIDSLLLTRSFWRWWRKVWQRIDEQFVRDFEQYQGLKEYEYLRKQWHIAHSPDNIIPRPTAEIVVEADRIRRQKVKSE